MKIAVYSHYFSPEIGAPSARLREMGREWATRGHSVDVVTCFPNHPTGKIYPGYRGGAYASETIDGMTVHRQWTYITPNRGFLKKTLGHISFLPSSLLISERHVPPADVYIGSSPTFFAAMGAAGAAARHTAPFIMEVRDLWPAIFVELGVLKNRTMIAALERLELSLYRKATRVVTVTESFRTNLIERGVPEQKVVTITNGADTNFWEAGDKDGARKLLGLGDRFIVLYIGAHGISQGLGSLLDAAARLREHQDVEFVFVGEGAVKEELQKQAAAEGLSNVRFFPPAEKDRVRDFYTACDVAVVPLRNIPLFETFLPSKLFEIMAMSRPIIGALAGEAASILDASEGGVIVTPEDGEGIASAVLSLKADSSFRMKLGESGRRFVKEKYSRSALAALYESTILDAVGDFKS